MSVASEITRLQNAKADLKTAIEGKGVTVPSSTKLDGYADLVDTISGGGTAPYIVNPLSGTIFGGGDSRGGIYTHQYQLSSGNVVDAYFARNSFNRDTEPLAPNSNYYGLDENEHIKWISADYFECRLEINNSGLLTLTLGGVNYEWLPQHRPIIFVILISDEGYTFVDNFDMYSEYSCFVKGTKITLSNGEKKAVEDITYEDNLLVWDFDLREKSQAEPLWITKTLVADNYKLVTLDDGKQMKLVGTGENCHRLFCVEDGEFVYANNMVGKTTIYEDDTQHKVISCEVINDNVEYYNIITFHHMNLYAEDVLTSCRYSNMYQIEDMRYVKDGRAIRPQSEYNVEDKYYYGLRLGESQIELDKTLRYINNLKHFEKK